LNKSSVSLGAFSKFLNAVFSIVMSVRMKKLGSHMRDCGGIWYLRLFQKSVEVIQDSLKSD
jgi:hypothetical protein